MLRITYYEDDVNVNDWVSIDVPGPIMFNADKIEFYDNGHLQKIWLSRIYSIDDTSYEAEEQL